MTFFCILPTTATVTRIGVFWCTVTKCVWRDTRHKVETLYSNQIVKKEQKNIFKRGTYVLRIFLLLHLALNPRKNPRFNKNALIHA
jgi:hypothetical protein